MPIIVQTPPHSSNLTLLATLKTELLITTTDNDDFLSALIVEASDAICGMCNRRFERMELIETLPGAGDYLVQIANTPIALFVSASRDGIAVSAGDISIYDVGAGTFYRTIGWSDTRDPDRPWAGQRLWSIRYWGGYMLPGDDVSAATISAAASDSSYNDSASGFPGTLVAGDFLLASGFATAGNNGLKRIISATAAKIVIDTALTTASASPIVTLAFRTLPRDIERACIDLVKTAYSSRDRDTSLSSKQIGDVRVGYFDVSAKTPNDPVRRLLGPYTKVAA